LRVKYILQMITKIIYDYFTILIIKEPE
jgi:hypothetical protein